MSDARIYVQAQGIESALADAVATVIKERPANAIQRISEILTNLQKPCFFIGHFAIQDGPGFGAGYASKVGPTVDAFGGKFIVRATPSTPDAVAKEEGESLGQVHVVIEFPSRSAALGWSESEAYKEIKGARDETSTLRGMYVDGLSKAGSGSGFFIGHFTIKDGPGFGAGYASKVGATVSPFGGDFLVRARPDPSQPSAVAKEEGTTLGQVHVIIQFETKEKATEWAASAAYQQLVDARQSTSSLNGLYVGGVA